MGGKLQVYLIELRENVFFVDDDDQTIGEQSVEILGRYTKNKMETPTRGKNTSISK